MSNSDVATKLRGGDVCRVVLDWCDEKTVKSAQCRILSQQHNNNKTFFKVLWIGKNAYEIVNLVGNLFEEDELRKVR